MKTLHHNVLLLVLLAGVPLTPTTVVALSPVIIGVRVTVLSYAEVHLEKTTLNVTITNGSIAPDSLYVGGTVVCNCPVILLAAVKQPAGAPGTWTVKTHVAEITDPGVFHFGDLVQVIVSDMDSNYTGDFQLKLSTAKVSQPHPDVGEVIVTVVPKN